MKRRRFFKTAIALPAGAALLAQQPQPKEPATKPTGQPREMTPAPAPTMEYPKIDAAFPDQAAAPVLHFFSTQQFAALKRLSDLIMPGGADKPGAIDAQAPEFLDFLIGKSLADRQKIYTAGLDALNKQSMSHHKKPFAELDAPTAAALIEPAMKQPWNYIPPADPLAHFLQEAKSDIRSATMNSREYATASAAAGAEGGGRGGRRQGGMGLYWYSLD